MLLSKLGLENFRNFSKSFFSFEDGINVIWGENAAGKSNLLEAIFFSGTGKPSKANREVELIQFGQPYARIENHFLKKNKTHLLEAALERTEQDSTRKVLKLNKNPVRKVSELVGEFKVVLFSPQDQSLVQGEPFFRRRFLDSLLSQLSPPYLHSYMKYQAVKEQRNSLLKQPSYTSTELFPWNLKLIETGSLLIFKRLEILPELSALAQKAHQFLCQEEFLEVQYLSSFPLPEPHNELTVETLMQFFEQALAKTAAEEKKRGMTLVGPHRDDLGIFIAKQDARIYGSQGQQKTAALALRLAEGELFEKIDEEPPIYLLDDCFSELDQDRQKAFCSFFLKNAQGILTTAEEPAAYLKGYPHIKLQKRGREEISCGIPG